MIERSAGTGLDDKNVENVSQATAKILRMLGQQGGVKISFSHDQRVKVHNVKVVISLLFTLK